MSVTDGILKTDYSKTFDDKRKALVCQSYYKYGKASKNFSTGNVDALGCIEKCLEKFKETKNTEYLLDLANYAMFRYMWPQNGEFFKHTFCLRHLVKSLPRLFLLIQPALLHLL